MMATEQGATSATTSRQSARRRIGDNKFDDDDDDDASQTPRSMASTKGRVRRGGDQESTSLETSKTGGDREGSDRSQSPPSPLYRPASYLEETNRSSSNHSSSNHSCSNSSDAFNESGAVSLSEQNAADFVEAMERAVNRTMDVAPPFSKQNKKNKQRRSSLPKSTNEPTSTGSAGKLFKGRRTASLTTPDEPPPPAPPASTPQSPQGQSNKRWSLMDQIGPKRWVSPGGSPRKPALRKTKQDFLPSTSPPPIHYCITPVHKNRKKVLGGAESSKMAPPPQESSATHSPTGNTRPPVSPRSPTTSRQQAPVSRTLSGPSVLSQSSGSTGIPPLASSSVSSSGSPPRPPPRAKKKPSTTRTSINNIEDGRAELHQIQEASADHSTPLPTATGHSSSSSYNHYIEFRRQQSEVSALTFVNEEDPLHRNSKRSTSQPVLPIDAEQRPPRGPTVSQSSGYNARTRSTPSIGSDGTASPKTSMVLNRMAAAAAAMSPLQLQRQAKKKNLAAAIPPPPVSPGKGDGPITRKSPRAIAEGAEFLSPTQCHEADGGDLHASSSSLSLSGGARLDQGADAHNQSSSSLTMLDVRNPSVGRIRRENMLRAAQQHHAASIPPPPMAMSTSCEQRPRPPQRHDTGEMKKREMQLQQQEEELRTPRSRNRRTSSKSRMIMHGGDAEHTETYDASGPAGGGLSSGDNSPGNNTTSLSPKMPRGSVNQLSDSYHNRGGPTVSRERFRPPFRNDSEDDETLMELNEESRGSLTVSNGDLFEDAEEQAGNVRYHEEDEFYECQYDAEEAEQIRRAEAEEEQRRRACRRSPRKSHKPSVGLQQHPHHQSPSQAAAPFRRPGRIESGNSPSNNSPQNVRRSSIGRRNVPSLPSRPPIRTDSGDDRDGDCHEDTRLGTIASPRALEGQHQAGADHEELETEDLHMMRTWEQEQDRIRRAVRRQSPNEVRPSARPSIVMDPQAPAAAEMQQFLAQQLHHLPKQEPSLDDAFERGRLARLRQRGERRTGDEDTFDGSTLTEEQKTTVSHELYEEMYGPDQERVMKGNEEVSRIRRAVRRQSPNEVRPSARPSIVMDPQSSSFDEDTLMERHQPNQFAAPIEGDEEEDDDEGLSSADLRSVQRWEQEESRLRRAVRRQSPNEVRPSARPLIVMDSQPAQRQRSAEQSASRQQSLDDALSKQRMRPAHRQLQQKSYSDEVSHGTRGRRGLEIVGGVASGVKSSFVATNPELVPRDGDEGDDLSEGEMQMVRKWEQEENRLRSAVRRQSPNEIRPSARPSIVMDPQPRLAQQRPNSGQDSNFGQQRNRQSRESDVSRNDFVPNHLHDGGLEHEETHAAQRLAQAEGRIRQAVRRQSPYEIRPSARPSIIMDPQPPQHEDQHRIQPESPSSTAHAVPSSDGPRHAYYDREDNYGTQQPAYGHDSQEHRITAPDAMQASPPPTLPLQPQRQMRQRYLQADEGSNGSGSNLRGPPSQYHHAGVVAPPLPPQHAHSIGEMPTHQFHHGAHHPSFRRYNSHGCDPSSYLVASGEDFRDRHASNPGTEAPPPHLSGHSPPLGPPHRGGSQHPADHGSYPPTMEHRPPIDRYAYGQHATARDVRSMAPPIQDSSMSPVPSTERTVEIAPNVRVRLRGAEETWSAIELDFYLPISCLACSMDLCCIQDADYVLCPSCRSISPMMHESGGGGESGAKRSGGVGLGFTYTDLLEWQQEIRMKRSSQRQEQAHRLRG